MSLLFLLSSDQELVLDLALHLVKNHCQQEIEWPERDLTRLYIFLVRAAKLRKDQEYRAREGRMTDIA